MIKKSRKQFVPDNLKDDKYWARRRKNNMAAKRSRDARRMKENQIALRAGYLEKEVRRTAKGFSIELRPEALLASFCQDICRPSFLQQESERISKIASQTRQILGRKLKLRSYCHETEPLPIYYETPVFGSILPVLSQFCTEFQRLSNCCIFEPKLRLKPLLSFFDLLALKSTLINQNSG